MRYLTLAAVAGLVLAAAGMRADEPAAGTCGKYGTSVEFVSSPREAAKLAAKDEKLVFVLHVSGHFEDPGVT